MKFKDFVKDVRSQIVSIASDHPIIDISDGKEKQKYRYYSFVLIACGIEMLGGALDDYCWHCPGLSEKRFNKALKSFNSLKKYKKLNLYSMWRCGMAHVLVPNKGIGLTIAVENNKHLEIQNSFLIIVLEEILKDFLNACDELVNEIDSEKPKLPLGDKVWDEILSVPQDIVIKN